ncbi:MAG TPA: hypothetical protein PKL83_04335, partial [bacterium]|nr:hypothetical protein [bacterium]
MADVTINLEAVQIDEEKIDHILLECSTGTTRDEILLRVAQYGIDTHLAIDRLAILVEQGYIIIYANKRKKASRHAREVIVEDPDRYYRVIGEREFLTILHTMGQTHTGEEVAGYLGYPVRFIQSWLAKAARIRDYAVGGKRWGELQREGFDPKSMIIARLVGEGDNPAWHYGEPQAFWNDIRDGAGLILLIHMWDRARTGFTIEELVALVGYTSDRLLPIINRYRQYFLPIRDGRYVLTNNPSDIHKI